MPLAFFITFSTYGTWLHGMDKTEGSVDREHNAYGTPFLAPDAAREERAAQRMTDPPYVLNETARTVVRDAIVELCREKGWSLLALHVRTNHVHCVISADREPGRLMSDIKARASRDLNRTNTDAHAKRWTRHGSTRHLFDDDAIAAAVAYTLDEQGPRMAHHRAAHEVSDATPLGAAHEEVSDSPTTHHPSETSRARSKRDSTNPVPQPTEFPPKRAAHEVSEIQPTNPVPTNETGK